MMDYCQSTERFTRVRRTPNQLDFRTLKRLLLKTPVLNLRMQLKSIQLMKFHKHRERLNQNFNQQLHTDPNSMKVSLRQPTYQNKFIFIIFMISSFSFIFFKSSRCPWNETGRHWTVHFRDSKACCPHLTFTMH